MACIVGASFLEDEKLITYTTILLIISAGIYTLGGTSDRKSKASLKGSERSGRSLAENEISTVSKGTLHGLRSYGGREELLQAKTQKLENYLHNLTGLGEDNLKRVEQVASKLNSAVQTPVTATHGTSDATTGGESEPGHLVHPTTTGGANQQGDSTAMKAAIQAPQAQALSQNVVEGGLSAPATGLYSFVAKGIDGGDVLLSRYSGKVTLVVNVASKCGYTESNYRGLNELYSKFQGQDFEILAFPCDSWHQEQGSESEIKSFVQNQYQAKFPLFAKVEASGPQIHPIFKWLISNLPEFQLTGWQPKWNFSKWLVDRNGYPVKSYDSAFDLERLSADIAKQLQTERVERLPTADKPPLSTSVV